MAALCNWARSEIWCAYSSSCWLWLRWRWEALRSTTRATTKASRSSTAYEATTSRPRRRWSSRRRRADRDADGRQGDDEQTATPMVVKGGRTPQFSHSRVVSLSCVVEEHLDYFETGCITFLIYGRQADSPPDKRLQKMSTRVRTQQSCLVIRTTTRKLAIADKSRAGRHITVLPVV